MEERCDRSIFESGRFEVGANYWASNAGTAMWRKFDEEAIRGDMQRMKDHNITLLRVFPLWSDFQPVTMLNQGGNNPCEVRMGESLLPFTPEGEAGIDPVMADRFERFLNICDEYGMKLIVGLITGWMSGRTFAPHMLNTASLLSDPLALKWEVKYVRYMVRRFRSFHAVAAWDLGNECNCLGRDMDADAAYSWTALISMTIRAFDPDRPIVSGMHSLEPNGTWKMQDQGELVDILCTHPYPLFTPFCDTDPINRMKNAMHATGEGLFYQGIGKKPCICEEIGTLGPMFASEPIAADYIRSVLFTLFAHDGRSLIWWCANEQSHLAHAPYDWCAVERELGLFRVDGSPKPVVETMRDFIDFLNRENLMPLPAARKDAVVITTNVQDKGVETDSKTPWAVAYGSFILAKMAHMNVSFVNHDQEIPESDVYMLPSLAGNKSLSRTAMNTILDRVEKGATLYVSIDDALLSPFKSYTGLNILTRNRPHGIDTVEFSGESYSMKSGFSLRCESVGAEVLARTDKGEIAFAKYAYGEGTVYTLLYPIERYAATIPGIVDGDEMQPLAKFYEEMGLRNSGYAAKPLSPTVGMTEHDVGNGTRIALLVNYEPECTDAKLALADGWRVARAAGIHGEIPVEEDGNTVTVPLANNTGCALWLEKA